MTKTVTCFFILCLAGLLPGTLLAQVQRNMLTGTYSRDLLKKNLTMTGITAAFPGYLQRHKWEAVDTLYTHALVKAGEVVLEYKWQTIPAATYLEFVTTGNRYIMEDIYNQNISAIKKLVFAELAEGKGRFIPQLINGVWAVCEITSWSLSASLNLQNAGSGLPDISEPVIELGAGITANTMAWAYYLFRESFDKYNPLIAKRIKLEIEKRILQPYYQRNDFWWMDLDGQKRFVNNWNVWLNFNVLTCILLVEDDSTKRWEGVYKTMRSVDRFINYYKEDGGCEEGPAYWSHAGGMLFNYLSLLQQATDGAINVFNQPLIRNIGAYIYKAHIDSSYYINYADAAAKLSTDAGIAFHYGKAANDTLLSSFGAYLARQQQWQKYIPAETIYGGIRNIFSAPAILSANPLPALLPAAWMEETGIATARDAAGSTGGFYFSALAGHNGESHNHNDVGSCILFYNGQPVLIDIGSGTYTRQTFGPERYSIWTMRSAWHNLPLINGTEQKEGQEYAARNTSFAVSSPAAVFSTDIAAAYPPTAAVKKWQRSYRLKRKKSFTISDDYQLLQNKGNTALHFMTSAIVSKEREGLLHLVTGNSKMAVEYNPKLLSFSLEEVPIKDARLLQSWPPLVYRLIFKCLNTKKSGKHHIVFKSVS